MPVKVITDNRQMKAMIYGEIDHHTAGNLRDDIDRELNAVKPDMLTLDFSGVSFMDSSAVGLVMGRYKNAKYIPCELSVSGLSDRDKRIMQMSGLQKLIKFE